MVDVGRDDGAAAGDFRADELRRDEDRHFGAPGAGKDVLSVCLSESGRFALSATGMGTITADHGLLPNPPPAVVGLLARANAPAYGVPLPLELTTPTGAALLTTLVDGRWEPLPKMSVQRVGYGAGGRTMVERPNVVQVVVGEPIGTSTAGVDGIEFATNVDDVTPEVLAHTVTRLLAAGASDAWIIPIVMKKGRPAHTVVAQCDLAHADSVRTVLIRETGTLGIRAARIERWPQSRTNSSVTVNGHAIRVKVGIDRIKVEHDDALTAAIALDRPLRDILRDAEAAAREVR